jgi:hypothetical protein
MLVQINSNYHAARVRFAGGVGGVQPPQLFLLTLSAL